MWKPAKPSAGVHKISRSLHSLGCQHGLQSLRVCIHLVEHYGGQQHGGMVESMGCCQDMVSVAARAAATSPQRR